METENSGEGEGMVAGTKRRRTNPIWDCGIGREPLALRDLVLTHSGLIMSNEANFRAAGRGRREAGSVGRGAWSVERGAWSVEYCVAAWGGNAWRRRIAAGRGIGGRDKKATGEAQFRDCRTGHEVLAVET